MQIQNNRFGGPEVKTDRKRFSDFIPVDRGAEQNALKQTEQAVSPLTRIDPELRQTLVMEALIRRMERLEMLQEKAEDALAKTKNRETTDVPYNAWISSPANEQDRPVKPKPDAKTAAAQYRKIGEL